MADIDELINNLKDSDEAAQESAKVTIKKSKPKPKSKPKTPTKIENEVERGRLDAFGNVHVRTHGAHKITQRIIEPIQDWMDNNTTGAQSVVLNYILHIGITEINKQLESGDVIVTDGHLPKKGDRY